MRDEALYLAAENGHVEILKILLNNARVDPTGGGHNEPLQLAVKKNRREVVKILLEQQKVLDCLDSYPNHFVWMYVKPILDVMIQKKTVIFWTLNEIKRGWADISEIVNNRLDYD